MEVPADGQDADHLASRIRNPELEISHDCFSQLSSIRGPSAPTLIFFRRVRKDVRPLPLPDRSRFCMELRLPCVRADREKRMLLLEPEKYHDK